MNLFVIVLQHGGNDVTSNPAPSPPPQKKNKRALIQTGRRYKASATGEKCSNQMITTKSTFYSNRSIGSLRYLPFLIQELIGWDIEIDNLCFYMLNILCPSLTTPALFF